MYETSENFHLKSKWHVWNFGISGISPKLMYKTDLWKWIKRNQIRQNYDNKRTSSQKYNVINTTIIRVKNIGSFACDRIDRYQTYLKYICVSFDAPQIQTHRSFSLRHILESQTLMRQNNDDPPKMVKLKTKKTENRNENIFVSWEYKSPYRIHQ